MVSLARSKARFHWPRSRKTAARHAPAPQAPAPTPASWVMRAGVLALAMVAVVAGEGWKGRRRGAGRETPLEVRPHQWRRIFVGAAKEFMDDRVPDVAAGIAYYTLLALFPALTAFVSLYGLFADPSDVAKQTRALHGLLPGDIVRFVSVEMGRLAGARHEGLGIAFAVGLALSIWGARSAAKALLSGLNVAYEVREHRSFLHLTLLTLGFTLGGLLVVLLLAGSAALTPMILPLPLWALAAIRIVLLLAMMIAGLALIYRYGPSRPHAAWKWVTPGSLVSILVWVAASWAFSWYAANFAHYERTYGSLAAVLGFMTWLWLSTMVVLFGAELNAEVEAETKGLPSEPRERMPQAKGR